MIGTELLPGAVRFAVWAPRATSLALRLYDGVSHRDVPLDHGPGDVWAVTVPGAAAGQRYAYVVDGARARPDPRARFQPDGVHGASMVIDPAAFAWQHGRPARALADSVLYELHVGTFTPEGTFAAAARELPHLADLGVTTISLMPVGAFAGGRNWGYDGAHVAAPNAHYGTPDELRALVDRAHGLGLSVLIDVVYNHVGPEGSYLAEFGPYTADAHKNLWGDGFDYARPEVRAWMLDTCLAWLTEYRMDGLRVDAVHAIVDHSSPHVLAELTSRARALPPLPGDAPGFVPLLVAETDKNDAVMYDAQGFDTCWSDDFHHALHACLTGEITGYYVDFGEIETLARVIADGWKRGPHPERAKEFAATRFIVSTQTHDQIGNRARGERLEHLVGAPAARLAAVALLAATPGVPMLFQGEEHAASTPFLYFTSHEDERLIESVRVGRRREFAEQGFAWPADVPDPNHEHSFVRSKLDPSERRREPHAAMGRLYRDLIALRKVQPGLGAVGKESCSVRTEDGAIVIDRSSSCRVVLNLGKRPLAIGSGWRAVLCSEDHRYGGAGDCAREVPARAAAVLVPARG